MGAPELIQERIPSSSSTVKNGVRMLEGINSPHHFSQVAGGVQSDPLVHFSAVSLHRSTGTNVQISGLAVTHGVASSLSINQLASASPGSTNESVGISMLAAPTMAEWVISGQSAPGNKPAQHKGQGGVRLVA